MGNDSNTGNVLKYLFETEKFGHIAFEDVVGIAEEIILAVGRTEAYNVQPLSNKTLSEIAMAIAKYES